MRYNYEKPPATLREALESQTVEHLRPRALHCAKELPTRKAELIDVIISTVHSPTQLKVLWSEFDPLSVKAISAALDNGGLLDEDAFRAQYGKLPWDTGKRNYLSAGYGKRDYLPVEVLIYGNRLPPDVIPLLTLLAPPHEKFLLTGTKEIPKADDLFVAETEDAALHDLAATLSFIADGKAAITDAAARPTTASLNKLEERLLHGEYLQSKNTAAGEPIRSFAWLVLVQADKLAKVSGSKLTLTPKGQKVLSQPEAAHLQSIFENWQHANQFDELTRIRSLKGFQKAKRYLSRPAERKKKILEALKQSPVGEWIEIESFFRAVRAWRCSFDVDLSDFSHLYVGDTFEYGYLNGFGSEDCWRALQAQFILICLWEYLATLGALDVAYTYPNEAEFELGSIRGISNEDYFSRYVGLRYFRINPLGAYLLGVAGSYAGAAKPESQPVFTVMPNYEIAIMHREQFTPNVRLLLERLAEAISEGVYQLQREKILTALETGLTLEAINDFLTSKSAHPLPQTVRVFLDDIQRNSRALKESGSAVLFQTTDAALAQLIVNDSALRKICFIANETTLIVPAEKETTFRRRVKQLGFGVRR